MIKNIFKEILPQYEKYQKSHTVHRDKIAGILIDGKEATMEANRYYQEAIHIN
jgi:hypothetical protein